MTPGTARTARRRKQYYRDDKPHREDGPAIVHRYADGSTEERYYRDGAQRTKDEYDAEGNPLLTGLRVPVGGGQDAIEALLREAITEQNAPVKPSGREYVPLPQP